MLFKTIFVAAVVAAAAICGGCAQSTTQDSAVSAPVAAEHRIYVIRHLEKAAGDDPPLSEAGAAQALELAEMLKDSGIVAIFATPTKRAMQTAAPLSDRLGIPVRPYDHRDPAALSAAVSGVAGSVLIVGHSNTVPDLVERFGGAKPAPLSEQDYGTLFIVTPENRKTETLTLPRP